MGIEFWVELCVLFLTFDCYVHLVTTSFNRVRFLMEYRDDTLFFYVLDGVSWFRY